MQIKFILSFLAITLLVAVPITAQELITEQIPSFEFNTQFDLKRACFDRGFFCDSAFVCNLTITKSDGTLMVDNQLMTRTGSYYNFTVDQGNNSRLGNSNAIMSCNNVSDGGPDTFVVQITGDGNPYRVFPQQFVIIGLAILMVFIGLINDRLRMFKHVGSILMMVMGVLTLFPGYSFINWTTLMGQSLGIILIGAGFYFLIEDSFSRDEQEDTYESKSVYVDDD